MLEHFGNVMELVKKIQQSNDALQEQLRQQRIEVASGDVIKIVVNGQQEVVAIEINGKYLSESNTALVQDLLVATMNNALNKSRELHQSAMNKLAADMNLPKIPGLF